MTHPVVKSGQGYPFNEATAFGQGAQREANMILKTELGVVARTDMASPDPVTLFFRATAGALAEDHDLEYYLANALQNRQAALPRARLVPLTQQEQ